jgi:hypothetical protein
LQILNPKETFYHEYDFGSTTYLDGLVLAEREGFLGKDKIRILARNKAYPFACENCGKKAVGFRITAELQ